MILRFLVLMLCMSIYMPSVWSMAGKRLKVSSTVTIAFFNALEKENYELLTNYSEVLTCCSIKNSDGDTPLHWAVRYKKTTLLQWLLKREQYTCDIEEKNYMGQTPFDLALQVADKSCALLILSYMHTLVPTLREALDKSLMQQSHTLTKEQVLALITSNYTAFARRAIPSIGNCNERILGTTLLHAAVGTGDYELVKALLDAGACPVQVDSQGATVLDKVQEYIDRVQDECLQVPECEETYYFDVLYKYEKISSLLKSYEKDKKAFTFWLNKILTNNAQDATQEDIFCLEMLTDQVSINMRDDQGLTPLHKAIAARKLGLMKVLLSCGADLFMPDFTGRTPFDLAVSQGDKTLKLVIVLAYRLRAQEQKYKNS